MSRLRYSIDIEGKIIAFAVDLAMPSNKLQRAYRIISST
jgi:hypothetical protein